MSAPSIAGQNINTFIENARVSGAFPEELADQLEEENWRLKQLVADLTLDRSCCKRSFRLRPLSLSTRVGVNCRVKEHVHRDRRGPPR